MKRIIFILIPSLIFGGIVFFSFQLFTKSQTERGALQVTTNPNSSVYLDGKLIGKTPLCKCKPAEMLKSGEYSLRLVPVDTKLNEFQEKITITKSVLTVVDRRFGESASSEGSVISLNPLKDAVATELFVLSFPDQAEVFLDNNLIGITPLQVKNITASDHALRVRKAGYTEKAVRIKTAKGYKLIANIYLGVDDSFISPTPTPPTASPSAALSTASRVTILQTPTGFLRVRSQATIASSEITRVSPGDSFELLEESDGWYKIKLSDGTLGWISAQYAEKQVKE